MSLIIGTAQFGKDYGLTNQNGKVPYEEVLKILSLVAQNGVVYLDTSSDYGEAESIIGQAREDLKLDLRVTTKLYREFDKEDLCETMLGIKTTLDRLKTNKVDTIMIHNPFWLMNKDFSDYVYGILMMLKGKKYADKIGVSVSAPEEAVEILNNYKLDVVQMPANLLDCRLLHARFLRNLSQVELQFRSVFLQGLLLMDPEKVSEFFDPIKNTLERIHRYSEQMKTSKVKMCIDSVRARIRPGDKIVVGVDNAQQTQDILDVFNSPVSMMPSFKVDDLSMITPGLWPVGGWK